MSSTIYLFKQYILNFKLGKIVETNELIEINITIPPSEFYENISDFPNEFNINFIRNKQNVNKKFIKFMKKAYNMVLHLKMLENI
jgi:uncharacterized protein (UPF0303 family)